jgi:hypothetical protein
MDGGIQESLTAIPEAEQLVIPAFAGMTNRGVWLTLVAFGIPKAGPTLPGGVSLQRDFQSFLDIGN